MPAGSAETLGTCSLPDFYVWLFPQENRESKTTECRVSPAAVSSSHTVFLRQGPAPAGSRDPGNMTSFVSCSLHFHPGFYHCLKERHLTLVPRFLSFMETLIKLRLWKWLLTEAQHDTQALRGCGNEAARAVARRFRKPKRPPGFRATRRPPRDPGARESARLCSSSPRLSRSNARALSAALCEARGGWVPAFSSPAPCTQQVVSPGPKARTLRGFHSCLHLLGFLLLFFYNCRKTHAA